MTRSTFRPVRVLVFAVLIVACGSREQVATSKAETSQRRSSPQLAQRASSLEESRLLLVEIKATLDALQGTPTQRARTERERVEADQDVYEQCMLDEGHNYLRPEITVREQVPSYVAAWWLPADEAYAAVDGFGLFTHNSGPIGVALGSYLEMSKEEQANYDAALNTCVASQDQGAIAALNPLAQELGVGLFGALQTASVADLVEVTTKYSTCMSQAGFKVAMPTQASDMTQELVYERGLENRDDPEVLQQAIELDRSVAIADARCRDPYVVQVATVLRPVYDSWVDAFATEIAAATDAWNR